MRKMSEISDEEYAKHAKESIKLLFKQWIFAAIMTVLSIPAILYIIFGSNETIKIFAWMLLLVMNIPALLKGIKVTFKTRNSAWFIVTMSVIAVCILIISRISGVVGNTAAIIGFFIFSAASLIMLLFPGKRDIFKNMIIEEGEKIDALTDGYSERPYSKESEILKEIRNFKEISLEFAKLLGKEGIIIDYDVWDNKIVMSPSFPFGDIEAFLFLKSRDSFVEIHKNGGVVVFISRSE